MSGCHEAGNVVGHRFRQVDAIDEIGINLYDQSFGTPKVAQTGMIRSLISSVSQELGGHTFSDRFLEQEWTDVVDAWQLRTWESYRNSVCTTVPS